MQLSDDGKEEFALALILLKDFKSQGHFDAGVSVQIIKMAEYLGIRDVMDKLQAKIPPMIIKPRD